MPDLWQFIDDIDADKRAMAIKRLEDRAQMPKFAAIRETISTKLDCPSPGAFMEWLRDRRGVPCDCITTGFSRDGGWVRSCQIP